METLLIGMANQSISMCSCFTKLSCKGCTALGILSRRFYFFKEDNVFVYSRSDNQKHACKEVGWLLSLTRGINECTKSILSCRQQRNRLFVSAFSL